MQYAEYLQSDHWKKLRKRKLKESPSCLVCKTEKTLEVHHIRYKNLTDVKLTDLRTLCEKCHRTLHKAKENGHIDFGTEENQKIDRLIIKTVKEWKVKCCEPWMMYYYFERVETDNGFFNLYKKMCRKCGKVKKITKKKMINELKNRH